MVSFLKMPKFFQNYLYFTIFDFLKGFAYFFFDFLHFHWCLDFFNLVTMPTHTIIYQRMNLFQNWKLEELKDCNFRVSVFHQLLFFFSCFFLSKPYPIINFLLAYLYHFWVHWFKLLKLIEFSFFNSYFLN